MELKFKRPLKTMLIAAAVIAAVCCIGECILLKKVPEAAAHYGLYIVFLLLAVAAAVSLAFALVVVRITR